MHWTTYVEPSWNFGILSHDKKKLIMYGCSHTRHNVCLKMVDLHAKLRHVAAQGIWIIPKNRYRMSSLHQWGYQKWLCSLLFVIHVLVIFDSSIEVLLYFHSSKRIAPHLFPSLFFTSVAKGQGWTWQLVPCSVNLSLHFHVIHFWGSIASERRNSFRKWGLLLRRQFMHKITSMNSMNP